MLSNYDKGMWAVYEHIVEALGVDDRASDSGYSSRSVSAMSRRAVVRAGTIASSAQLITHTPAAITTTAFASGPTYTNDSSSVIPRHTRRPAMTPSGTPTDRGERADHERLPRDAHGDLTRGQPEGAQHRQLARPLARAGEQRMGDGADGQEGQERGQVDRQAAHLQQVVQIVGRRWRQDLPTRRQPPDRVLGVDAVGQAEKPASPAVSPACRSVDRPWSSTPAP